MNDLMLMRKNLWRKPVRTSLLLISIFIAFLLFGVLVATGKQQILRSLGSLGNSQSGSGFQHDAGRSEAEGLGKMIRRIPRTELFQKPEALLGGGERRGLRRDGCVGGWGWFHGMLF